MAYQSLPKRLDKWSEKWVPGLRVYLKREGLRDADKLIRDELVKRLDTVKGVLDNAKKSRVDKGSLKNLDRLDRAARKIEKVRDTIRFDSRGYRGIFDPEEVTEKDLMALLDFDEKLFGAADEMESRAQSVAKLSDAELGPALTSFEEQVEAVNTMLGQREKYSSEKLPRS
jgi:hypothetical protein